MTLYKIHNNYPSITICVSKRSPRGRVGAERTHAILAKVACLSSVCAKRTHTVSQFSGSPYQAA